LAPLGGLLSLEERLEGETPELTGALYDAAGQPSEGNPEAARRRLALIALRRALHNRRRVSPAQLEEARGILEPGLFAAVSGHLERRGELDRLREDYAQAFRAGLPRARRALLNLAGRPLFHEGVRLVSRSLLGRLQTMSGMDSARWRHDERHAGAKLAAYAARFATKTSPNSVFCATATAWIEGGETRISGSNHPQRLDALLSVAEARKITACVGIDRQAWPAIVPRPNPTLRRVEDGAWSFWRPSSLRRDDDDEALSRTRAQPVLDLFLEEAGRGTLAVPALLAVVSERAEIDVEELVPFFEKLVDAGLLIAEIEPPYNTRRPLRFVAERMRAAGAEAPWLPGIEAAEREVDALPEMPPGERIAALDRLEERISALPHRREIKGDELFRVDAASGFGITLPEHLLADLEPPLRRYVRLFAGLYPEMAFRAAWARGFLSRCPPDADVPLLDLYHGLFEPEEKQRPESFPPALPGASDSEALLDRVRGFFAERARAAHAAGREEVEITEDDWDRLLDGLPEPTWSAGILFQIAARNPEEIDAGSYRIILNALFGAGIAFARFAHLHGDAVAREVAKSWEPLAREGAILAEVTYNHFARSANAGLRPSLFPYEIELPGERASPGAEVVPLRELTVRWDSGERRFVLRWPARGVEVIPVISSGVSPEGFVHFLVEIGRQGLQPLAVFPGFEVPGVSRWPRFVSGKLVLFRRRWVFAPGETPEPPQEGGDAEAAEFFLRTARWRRDHGLPRHVFVHTPAEPKPWYADLDSPLSVDLLRRTLGSSPTALHVSEMLPGPDEMWVRDGKGRYAAEFLVQGHSAGG
jgi:hypothetical protein